MSFKTTYHVLYVNCVISLFVFFSLPLSVVYLCVHVSVVLCTLLHGGNKEYIKRIYLLSGLFIGNDYDRPPYLYEEKLVSLTH